MVLLWFTVPGASAADMQSIRDAIQNATSLQEVERLTKLLQSGQIPNGNATITSNNGHGDQQPETEEVEEGKERLGYIFRP